MAHTPAQQRASRRARILATLDPFQRAYVTLALRDSEFALGAVSLDAVPLKLLKSWVRDCEAWRLSHYDECTASPAAAAQRCYLELD